MDCMEAMYKAPDNHWDLAICDPPYGIGYSNQRIRVKPSRPNSVGYDIKYPVGAWDSNHPTKEYFVELFRVSKNQIIWGANYFCDMLPPGKGWIFWNKKNGIDNSFSDGEFAYSSKGIQSRYVALSVNNKMNRAGKDRIHPTEKPYGLYTWLLERMAKQGDRILDTHLGSGSIALACHDMGFHLDGFEIDKEYFDNASKRLKNHQRQLKLF